MTNTVPAIRGTRARFIRAMGEHSAVRFRAWWCPEWTEREILRASSTQVEIQHPTKSRGSWLDYPKASEIVETETGVFKVAAGAGAFLAYDFRGMQKKI